MVETLVFETPTPLPEHAEREFGFPPDNSHHHIITNNNNHVNVVLSKGITASTASVASVATCGAAANNTYTTNHHNLSNDPKTGIESHEE